MLYFLLFYLAAVNVIGAAVAAYDKAAARRGAWRIPERQLFFWCLVGGCPGVYLAMRLLHHKTRHKKFMWGIPAIFAAQCAICAAVWYYLY